MVTAYYFDEYITETARLSILKAKVACTCQRHPEILILTSGTDAQRQAYQIAISTLACDDKLFLQDPMIDAVGLELDSAGNQCVQCLQQKSA